MEVEPWVGPKPDEEMAKVCSFLACLLIVNRSKKDLEHFHTFVFHPASLKDDDGETGRLGKPTGLHRAKLAFNP